MPFCPECKYEYREGIERCPDCDVKLVKNLTEPVEPTEEETNEEMVSVFSTDSQIEANLVKDMLEASGVEVYSKPDMSFYGNFADTLANLEVYVLESDAARARALIKESQESNKHFE